MDGGGSLVRVARMHGPVCERVGVHASTSHVYVGEGAPMCGSVDKKAFRCVCMPKAQTESYGNAKWMEGRDENKRRLIPLSKHIKDAFSLIRYKLTYCNYLCYYILQD